MNQEIPEELLPAIIAWSIWHYSDEFPSDYVDRIKKIYPELAEIRNRKSLSLRLFGKEDLPVFFITNDVIPHMEIRYQERAKAVYLEMLMASV